MDTLLCRLLPTFLCLAALSCAAPGDLKRAGALDDGVYLVVRDAELAGKEPPDRSRIVEVDSLPMKGEPVERFLIVRDPIARFRQMTLHEFQFDQNHECTRVVFQNTDEIKAFSRGHVGSRVAMVIDGKAVTCHKVRVPLEADRFEISFCTPGGGDHLHEHLKKVVTSRR